MQNLSINRGLLEDYSIFRKRLALTLLETYKLIVTFIRAKIFRKII